MSGVGQYEWNGRIYFENDDVARVQPGKGNILRKIGGATIASNPHANLPGGTNLSQALISVTKNPPPSGATSIIVNELTGRVTPVTSVNPPAGVTGTSYPVVNASNYSYNNTSGKTVVTGQGIFIPPGGKLRPAKGTGAKLIPNGNGTYTQVNTYNGGAVTTIV